MKKRRFLIPLLIILCLICLLALISCGHTHVLTRHAEIAPTCGANGYLEYWECTDCGKFFPDSTANAELGGLDSISVPALHPDAVVHRAATAADCYNAGNVEYWECTACNKYYADASTSTEIVNKSSVVVAATKHNGTLIHHAATAADCYNAGTIEYWSCSACNQLFADAAATVSITQSQTVSPTVHRFDADNYCAACDWQKGTDGLKYTLNNDGESYSVTGIGTASGDIVITNRYEGKPVTSIGKSAFSYCHSLTTITIPASVTSISSYAFSGCDSLTTVEFGANSQLTSIGSDAFYSCDSLTTITIPASVTSIGERAFSDCDSLSTITIPASVTSIGERAFSDCDSLSTITIPASVTSIGSYAFSSCDSLTTVEFAANSQLQSIGSYTFYNCDSLTTVEFGANSQLTSIGDYAFEYCFNLTTVEFGANSQLQSIGSSAFYSCSSLTNITIPAGVTSIGYSAFYNCDNLTTITIPASVTSVESSAFSSCDNLISVTFETTEGWWYASSSDATSGTAISATDLSDPTTAADRLKITYSRYYWFRG